MALFNQNRESTARTPGSLTLEEVPVGAPPRPIANGPEQGQGRTLFPGLGNARDSMRSAERVLCGWGVAVLACCVLRVSLGDESASDNTPHLSPRESKLGNIDWYPIQARRAGLEGRVLVAFNVTPAGQATNASIIWAEEPIFEAPTLGFLARSRFQVPPDWQASGPSRRLRLGFVFCLNPSGQSSDFAMPVELVTITASRLNRAPVRSKPAPGASGPCVAR